jgi:hypothetical protein
MKQENSIPMLNGRYIVQTLGGDLSRFQKNQLRQFHILRKHRTKMDRLVRQTVAIKIIFSKTAVITTI